MQKVDEQGREIERRRFIQLEMRPVAENSQQVDSQIKKLNSSIDKKYQELTEKNNVNITKSIDCMKKIEQAKNEVVEEVTTMIKKENKNEFIKKAVSNLEID